MKTIGETLKSARVSKGYTLSELAEEIKIKKSFIKWLEDEAWDKLPDFSVVTGYVKSYAGSVGLNINQTVAILRRDYPPKKLNPNPKPDLSERFKWSPKLTYVSLIAIPSLILIGYLYFQYLLFVRPPKLDIISPVENLIVNEEKLSVYGKTDPEAVVKVNNQPVIVESDGSFHAEVLIYEKTENIEVKAISREGKETVVNRKIIPKLSQ